MVLHRTWCASSRPLSTRARYTEVRHRVRNYSAARVTPVPAPSTPPRPRPRPLAPVPSPPTFQSSECLTGSDALHARAHDGARTPLPTSSDALHARAHDGARSPLPTGSDAVHVHAAHHLTIKKGKNLKAGSLGFPSEPSPHTRNYGRTPKSETVLCKLIGHLILHLSDLSPPPSRSLLAR